MVKALPLLAALPLVVCGLPTQAQSGPALFVANKVENSLVRFDLASGEETGRVPTCTNPHELSLSPDGEHVALACYGGAEVEIYTSADLEQVTTIELAPGARPHGIEWHKNGTLFATAEGRGAIFMIEAPLSAAPVVTEIKTSETGGPHQLVVAPDATAVWGTNTATGEVVRVDLAQKKLTHTAALGGGTEAIALSSDGSALWIGANEADKAYRLDPTTLEIRAEVSTGRTPIRLQVHPNGKYAVTSELGTGAMSVIDTATNKIVRTIPVSGSQAAAQVTLFFSADGSKAYVAETGPGTVAEVDFASGEVLRRFTPGPGGDGMAVR
jgi:DNA-binding beta-propeller fold protein YncE